MRKIQLAEGDKVFTKKNKHGNKIEGIILKKEDSYALVKAQYGIIYKVSYNQIKDFERSSGK